LSLVSGCRFWIVRDGRSRWLSGVWCPCMLLRRAVSVGGPVYLVFIFPPGTTYSREPLKALCKITLPPRRSENSMINFIDSKQAPRF
jgi:hypothetical protein